MVIKEQAGFNEFDNFKEGLKRLLSRINLLTENYTLEWRVGLVLENSDSRNLQLVCNELSKKYDIFRTPDKWANLSQILKNNPAENFQIFTFWLEMAKLSGFLDDNSTVWIIRADSVLISEDQSVEFQISIVSNITDGGTVDTIQREFRLRNKFILFVFSIEDFRALRAGDLNNRMSTLRPINPMAFLHDALLEE